MKERKRIAAVPKNKAAQRSKSFHVKGQTVKTVLIAWYVARRDRIVVSTLRCGRSNLGSNPSHGTVYLYLLHCIYQNNSWPGRRPPKQGGSG